MNNHIRLLNFLATPGVQNAFQAQPGRAFVSDITFPTDLASAKFYVSTRAPTFQPSVWFAPLRQAGFQPTPAQTGRFLAALRACGATGAHPWNLQATWDAVSGGWGQQVKIYLRCEHLPPLDDTVLRTLWGALGAKGTFLDALVADGVGAAIEGVACTLDGAGLPLMGETYHQGAGTAHDCVSVERTPKGSVTTCHYTHMGSACDATTLAERLEVDVGTMEALCALLPEPAPSAVSVHKSTPGRDDQHGVCVQTTPAQPGMDL